MPRKPKQTVGTATQYWGIRQCHRVTSDIPEILRNLSFDDLLNLRPFDVDADQHLCERHGYRVKTGALVISPSYLSVQQKIQNITYRQQRNHVERTFNFPVSLPRFVSPFRMDSIRFNCKQITSLSSM
jgi:hypothetical protein